MIAEMTQTISIAEAARRAGMHPNTLRYWIQRRCLETVGTPLGRVVVRESLDEFLRDREQKRGVRLDAA